MLSPDTTPGTAERLALVALFRTIGSLEVAWEGKQVYVVIDNSTAYRRMKDIAAGRPVRSRWGWRDWLDVQEVVSRTKIKLHPVWVPSHGKKKCWSPPPEVPMTKEECRRLNQLADTAATEALQDADQAQRIPQVPPSRREGAKALQRLHAAYLEWIEKVDIEAYGPRPGLS